MDIASNTDRRKSFFTEKEFRSQQSGVRMTAVRLVDESGFKAPEFIRGKKK